MMPTLLDFFAALALFMGWSVIITIATVAVVFLFFLAGSFLDHPRKRHNRR